MWRWMARKSPPSQTPQGRSTPPKADSARGERFDAAAQAANHALLAEHEHRFKQRRRHGLSHNRDTRRIDQETRLYAFSRSQFAQSMVARVVIPVGKSRECVRQFAEH